ncbi:Synaptic Vesicle Glycoprotein 2C [Manis pentadactyla]|nr:Synaptic Vesicle Glycoprotein 2C [Manis pentadactyla]
MLLPPGSSEQHAPGVETDKNGLLELQNIGYQMKPSRDSKASLATKKGEEEMKKKTKKKKKKKSEEQLAVYLD